MLKPTHYTINKNYVRRNKASVHYCKGYNFDNDCAIRMSEALILSDKKFLQVFEKSGVNLCPHGCVRGAQDLAFAFMREFGNQSHGWEARSSETDIPAKASYLQGLICFMNIPGYAGQGHIDLWDGTNVIPTIEANKGYWNSRTIWLWKLP